MGHVGRKKRQKKSVLMIKCTVTQMFQTRGVLSKRPEGEVESKGPWG
jgi:hypothetical protein